MITRIITYYSLYILLGIIYFWPLEPLIIKHLMKPFKVKSLNHFQVQQLDEQGLLPQPIKLKSNLSLGYRQATAKCANKYPNKKADSSSNKKMLLYFIGFGFFALIIILDLASHFGLSFKHHSDFTNNLQHIKVETLSDKSNIIDISLPKAKNYKTDSEQYPKQNKPDFSKLSDIIKRQYAKQTIAQKNSQYKAQTEHIQKVIQQLQNTLSTSISQVNTTLAVTTNGQSLNELKPQSSVSSDALPTRNKRVGYRSGQTAGITLEQKQKARKWRQLVNQDFTIDSVLAREERQYYIQKHDILDYKQLAFCIVVPTFNNAPNSRYLNNIRSIVMQEYGNYHIVIIDDASTDKTGELIADFLNQQNKIPRDRYQVITNSEQKLAMVNLRRAANQFCQPNQIFLIVDGDDELLGRQVLHLFNADFQKNQVWFVYSNFLGLTGNIGYSRAFPSHVLQENSYRRYPFVTSHLRAYYTQLFRNVKDEDLKDDKGEYYRAANDVAICIPILEQAHNRVMYIPQLTYFYNSNTGLNNHIVRLTEQKGNEKKIRKKASYQQLKTLQFLL